MRDIFSSHYELLRLTASGLDWAASLRRERWIAWWTKSIDSAKCGMFSIWIIVPFLFWY